jgi:hypothetical protein
VTLPCSAFRPRRASTARKAPPWHSSYAVGSWAWAPHFALRATHAPGLTGFHRDSFGLLRPAQHAVDTKVRPQRLLTSRAHRLGKPHRTTRPLTPSVAGRALNRALHAHSSSPCGSPRDVNHAGIPALPGAGLAIVGLAPRRTRYQDAFRWLDLRPRDRSRLARALFHVRSRSPRTLSPTANRPPSSTVDRRVKLTLAGQNEPFDPHHPPGKMRLPNVCNRLATRAPSGSPGPRITASICFRG